ncbi:hypothetical protein OS493_013291 [Desmophyllum pertusum]|uniref:Uncharacterized protein n=1 Tax=Desmophyllum pertusum TaxID=174260 RepID=A0A9W9YTE5_9CNID|nr:hypothetical protein OS493_013291 [Desmophyllum pertusum]
MTVHRQYWRVSLVKAMSYEGSQLLPVKLRRACPLSETPTELNNEQSDGVEKNGRAEQDTNMPSDFEDDKVEVSSLKLSYEDLGSSFASEMQAMLSHFVEDGDEPVWNASPSANPEILHRTVNMEQKEQLSMTWKLEIAQFLGSFLSTQDDSNSIPPVKKPLASNGV